MNATKGLRSRWNNRSVRFQLATIIAVVGIILIVLNAAMLSVFLRQYVLNREGTSLGQQADGLSRCAPNSILVQMYADQPSAADLVQAVLGTVQTRHAVLVDQAGSVRYATPMSHVLEAYLLARVRQDLALHQLITYGTPPWHTTGNQIFVDLSFSCSASAQTGDTGTTQGALLVAEDQQVAENAWQQVLEILLLAGLAVTAIGVLAAAFLGDAMTRSIRTLTSAARAIAVGDFQRRVKPQGPAEVAEMSMAFNSMVEEVVRQRRVERDLLANISHELASPLGLIRGYAEALADGVIASDGERAAALQAIVLETSRLQRLTGDLLDLALLETGQVSLSVESVPVAELLIGLRDRLAPVFRSAGVTVTVNAPNDLVPIWTDGQRLEQILVNLLNNAVHHTPPGGTIELTATQDDAGLVIIVKDSGVGIPPEELPRIWERFYQVEKGRDRREREGGVGLGLAIVRSTVALLQGRIDVESAVGAGTSFTLRFPARLRQTEG